jgi:hypothetical protein
VRKQNKLNSNNDEEIKLDIEVHMVLAYSFPNKDNIFGDMEFQKRQL